MRWFDFNQASRPCDQRGYREPCGRPAPIISARACITTLLPLSMPVPIPMQTIGTLVKTRFRLCSKARPAWVGAGLQGWIGAENRNQVSIVKRHGAGEDNHADGPEIGLLDGVPAGGKAGQWREMPTALVPNNTRERAKSGVNSHKCGGILSGMKKPNLQRLG